jgi:hypothetical protein
MVHNKDYYYLDYYYLLNKKVILFSQKSIEYFV